MKLDGYAWWKNRFKHMEQYMDAIRIDHILGFFRIWSIPFHAIDGVFGHFIPAMPITELSLRKRGIQASTQKLKKPLFNPKKCHDLFGKHADAIADLFFDQTYHFKEAYATQKSIVQYLKQHPEKEFCKQFLFDTMTDVILWEEEQHPGNFHFRIDMMETDSFQTLEHGEQEKLKRAYYDYFYHDQNECWRNSANEKLSAIRKNTNLMICAEDLGMVPNMVEEVLQCNDMLALQIQRMPKRSGQDFAHPKDAPYLSVVMPSTHDMSPLRAWWLEPTTDHSHFWENQLNQSGNPPLQMDEHLARKIIHSHLASPAMWSIFLLQDLFAISSTIAKPNPKSERINDPANPNHFWNYRSHLSIEQLQKKSDFQKNIQSMLRESGR
jgi:4-alpha-glucanotransferase